MGGGDLNMKKSWHPALMKNQEQVWLKEKDALEEKKKLAQLRKEKEEERQMQELQRLQEEQTGRKRQERLDWMYATPASGSTTNASDLEEYLLGKKRVDKLLIGDEHAKIGASHKEFIAVQNANTQRDILSKIREDPMLAIKQQEQAAYQSLMNNPLKLKELQMKNGGIKDKKDKKRKHDRDRDRRRSRSRSRSRSPARRRSASPRSLRYDDRDRDYDRDYRRHDRSRSRSPSRRRDRDDYDRPSRHSRDGRGSSRRSRSRTPERRYSRRSITPPRRRDTDDSSRAGPTVHPSRAAFIPKEPQQPASSLRTAVPQPDRDAERAAKLAAMTAFAQEVQSEREVRLAEIRAREKEELAREAAARSKTLKHGVGSFLDRERSNALMGSEGTLGERIRRGRSGLVALD